MENMIDIDIRDLVPNEKNPRKDLGDLTELADSIRESGVLQNLTVVFWADANPKASDEEKLEHAGQYTVIIGHRRLAAAKLAGLSHLPCTITTMTEEEQFSTMMLENLQRVDLTVYEQAEGFQLMMDMGETVSSIQKKTGISETTVRRRLKMAELDKEQLREAAGRQVTMADFDKLAKVEDVQERNQLLKSIGTPNFNYRYESAIKEQMIEKQKPIAREAAKIAKLKELKNNEQYSAQYNRMGCLDLRTEIEEVEVPLGATHYAISNGYFSYFSERPKPKITNEEKEAEKKNQEEAACRERKWKKLEEMAADFYALRENFADEIRLTKSNRDEMLRQATKAIIVLVDGSAGGDSDEVLEIIGLEDSDDETIIKAIDNAKVEDLPKIIYAAYGDGGNVAPLANGWEMGSEKHYGFPRYERTINLEALYRYLQAFGYEMADEEKAFLDGSHEVYQHGQG